MQRSLYTINDRLDIGHHIAGGKPYDPKAQLFEKDTATRIMSHLRGFAVLAAIDLDNQARRQTDEIREIRTKRKLTAKPQAIELLVTEKMPKLLFGHRSAGAQLPGTECPPPPKRRPRRRFAPSHLGRG